MSSVDELTIKLAEQSKEIEILKAQLAKFLPMESNEQKDGEQEDGETKKDANERGNKENGNKENKENRNMALPVVENVNYKGNYNRNYNNYKKNNNNRGGRWAKAKSKWNWIKATQNEKHDIIESHIEFLRKAKKIKNENNNNKYYNNRGQQWGRYYGSGRKNWGGQAYYDSRNYDYQ